MRRFVLAGDLLWEGETKDLASMATGGKVVRRKYRVTTEYVYEDAGVIGSREEQIPLWAIRDIDVKQSILQKTRGVGDVRIRVEANDYTGKKEITFESIETPKEVRDLLNEYSRSAREHRLKQQQSVNYTGLPPVSPLGAGVASAAVPSEDPIAKLTKLGELLKSGLLTQEEFDAQKLKLLS
ncbi:MAG: PH domain-containing protein [Actinomycetota bacterium]